MEHTSHPGASVGATARKGSGLSGDTKVSGRWGIVCRDKHGRIKWTDYIDNLVTNGGKNYLLDVGLSAGTQISTWYVGLTDGTPTTDATDSMSSHAGWVEVTAYDEAARVTWTDGGVSSQSVSNSASTADFTISTNSTTVGGAFLTSVNTKGGTTGTLYAVGAFSAGDKALDDGDTLSVTATFTQS